MTTDQPPGDQPSGDQPISPELRRKRTIQFAVVVTAVVGTFTFLSTLQGPPPMPLDPIHKPLQKDSTCLACHFWPGMLAPGTVVVKPMGPNHPPPKPKKMHAGMDAGFQPDGTPIQLYDCLKCHAPK